LNHPDATGFFRASVGVEQIVFDIGRGAATGAASAGHDMAAAEATNRAHALALATIETFGRVLTAQASAAAARTAIEAGRQDLERARHRRDAGLVTDADVLALVVHVADLERRRIQAEGDAAIARAELNRLMGSPIDRDFRVVEPSSSASEGTRDLTALLAEAEASRPDLQRAAAAERLADFNRRAARAAVVPTVAAHAAFDASGLHLGERVSSWIAGVELRWSLSTGGAEIARLDASSRAVERARAESDDLRAAVHVDVVAALRRLEAAEARLAAGRAAVEQAREAERIVRDRYEAGIASVTDVLRAAAAVLDAEANRASALVDGVVSSALLNRAIGRRPL
jgi:outer membrane protein TolC